MQEENSFLKKSIFALLLMLVVLYTLPQVIQDRPFWYSDEVRHAATYQAMQENDEYFTLSLNGTRYTDKPPVYFWFLNTIEIITGLEGEKVFFLGTMLSILAFVSSTYFLAYVTKASASIMLCAVCMSLTSAFTLALTQFSRMDTLFAATINFSFALFYLAFDREKAVKLQLSAFILMALACLIKGPFALAFPIVSALVYLFWTKNLKRFFRKDVLFGFLSFMAIILFWFLGIVFEGQLDYIIETFKRQIADRAVDSWHHKAPWYYYIIYLPLLILPYSIIPLLSIRLSKDSFKSVRNTIDAIATSRKILTLPLHADNNALDKEKLKGKTYLYCVFISSFLVLTLVSAKLAIYALPLFPVCFILLSQIFINFSTKQTDLFSKLLAFLLFVLALAFLVIKALPVFFAVFSWFDADAYLQLPNYYEKISKDMPSYYIALAFFLASLLLFVLRKSAIIKVNAQVKILLAYTVSLGLCVWVIIFTALPHVNPYLTTKGIAQQVKSFVDEGYTPISYRIYEGTFTYYAENNFINIRKPAQLEEILKNKSPAVLVIRTKYFNILEHGPYFMLLQDAKIIDRQYISTTEYMLLTIDTAPQSLEQN